MVSEAGDHPSVRILADGELDDAARLVSVTMLGSLNDETVTGWAQMWRAGAQTAHGAFAPGGGLAGVARWFPTELSLAGPSVPAACVTAVAVLASHRRRGHLRRLMEAQLRSVADADIPVALLVAAEWPIYGRYGYGPAVEACGYEIDTAARFNDLPTGTIEQVTPAELRPHLEAVHDLRWARTTGAVTRLAPIWDSLAGVTAWPSESPDLGLLRGALWRDPAGAVQGAVSYKVEQSWTHNRPTGTIVVRLLVGATPEAERELWRHLCETDWVATVKAGDRGVQDPLPLFLHDARAAVQVDRSDCIWARLLDLPRVFEARRAPTAGRAVVEVLDDLGYANGRWALELGPDGASVGATDATADVRLPVSALGAASMGGTSVGRLHEAGWLDEERPGGVARLDAILRTPTAPWSPTTY
jgi:predicted acetyltransferase